MDINVLRSMVTLAAFVAFLGVLVWVFLPSRQKEFDDAAQMPFRSESD